MGNSPLPMGELASVTALLQTTIFKVNWKSLKTNVRHFTINTQWSRGKELILFEIRGNHVISTAWGLEIFDAGNSLNFAVTAVIGQRSRVTLHCYPLAS